MYMHIYLSIHLYIYTSKYIYMRPLTYFLFFELDSRTSLTARDKGEGPHSVYINIGRYVYLY